MLLDVEEFEWTRKYRTLLHHHGPFDRILREVVRTGDYEQFARYLMGRTGSREVVLESAYVAVLSHDSPSVTDPYPKTMSPFRECNDTPSPPDPMPHPCRTRTRSRGF